jgi:hypothetical protein
VKVAGTRSETHNPLALHKVPNKIALGPVGEKQIPDWVAGREDGGGSSRGAVRHSANGTEVVHARAGDGRASYRHDEHGCRG